MKKSHAQLWLDDKVLGDRLNFSELEPEFIDEVLAAVEEKGMLLDRRNRLYEQEDCRGCDGEGEDEEMTECPSCLGLGAVKSFGPTKKEPIDE